MTNNASYNFIINKNTFFLNNIVKKCHLQKKKCIQLFYTIRVIKIVKVEA